MHWKATELPSDCHRRILENFPGDPELVAKDIHPVEKEKQQILAALEKDHVVAVKANTASGKSVCLPSIFWTHASKHELGNRAILIVQRQGIACEELRKSLFDLGDKWENIPCR